ncbi:ScyD/ScyE family protein [Egicoccus sp. AB-alg2]|uniref:ScyD/ScyE family protein n=1 Tax=Egicoccus sp. AB-alg2 TaxID=3242693 RepID=UPI00359D4E66
MIEHQRRRLRRGTAAGLGAVLALSMALPAGADTVVTPVVEDVAMPLGLAIGEDGTIYVAEAFFALTTVDRDSNRTTRYEGAVGGVDATGKGNVAVVGGGPTQLTALQPSGRTSFVASLEDHETAVNPDGGVRYGFVDADEACQAELGAIADFLVPYDGIVESNPYAVAVAGGEWFVADAAGNTIVRVGRNGRVSTHAVLPPVPVTFTQELVDGIAEQYGIALPSCVVGQRFLAEPVPTDVEVGPDGDLYVSSLPGFPELPGMGGVFRVDRRSGAASSVATGLTGAVDLAVAGDGTIYVAELFAGRISAVSGGAVSTLVEVDSPAAIEVARDGTVYATTGAFGPSGAVVTITP